MALGRAIIFLVIAVGGLAMAGYGWIMYQNQQSDIQQAVTVEGTVESSEVEFISVNQSSDDSSGSSHYEVVVRYTYTYDGQSHTSSSVYPGSEKNFRFKEEAREVANQYSPGQTVTVYVNQKNPSRSFLIKEKTHIEPFMIMGLGTLVAIPFLLGVGKEIVSGLSGG